MKKLTGFLSIMFVVCGVIAAVPGQAEARNYGDYRSSTLVSKAWEAMGEDDVEAVIDYTNKVIELYGEQATGMQESLTDFPTGDDEEIFAFWALNDAATAMFVQGEAYRKAGMNDEAVAAYQTILDKYSYGQCWDQGGWFWKPAEAAKEKIDMVESGSNLDFGDYASSTLATKAWEALGKKDLDGVLAYTDKILQLYADKAKEMEASLTEYPWESKEKIFNYWALNDVATALFIKGEALNNAGRCADAKKAFELLVSEYSFGQCWDPKGWFWKPAEAAQTKIDNMDCGDESASASADTSDSLE